MIDFAARARAARVARRWTQEDVADAIGKSRPWVGMFEGGRIRRLSPEDMAALTKVLGLERETPSPLVTMDERTLEEMLVRAAELGAERAIRRIRREPAP